MRYAILQPARPVDPRQLDFASIEALHDALPKVADPPTEPAAVEWVRDRYPDAIVMPIPMRIGSGVTVLLGIIASVDVPHAGDGTIPFSAFVAPTPQTDKERLAIKNAAQGKGAAPFARKMWSTPTAAPNVGVDMLDLELRASNMETPVRLTGKVGRRLGADGVDRLCLQLEHGGTAISIEFRDAELVLVENEGAYAQFPTGPTVVEGRGVVTVTEGKGIPKAPE